MRNSQTRLILAVLIVTNALAGCLSFSSSSPSQPASSTTVVVPQGTTVVKCQDGTEPPCP